MKITTHWRRSRDARPILYLDVLIEDEHGWRMESFAAYQLMWTMWPELAV